MFYYFICLSITSGTASESYMGSSLVDIVATLWVADTGLNTVATVTTGVVETLHPRTTFHLVRVAWGGLELAL